MTEKCFLTDSYLRELEATVTVVDGNTVEFDRTIFYPLGGGQSGDSGVITTRDDKVFTVEDTRKGDSPDQVIHHLEDDDHGLSVGDEVTLRIDWDRRYRHMRMHTSMHLLGSLIPVPVTGGQVGAEKSRLDFDIGDHQLDKEVLTSQMNQLTSAGHDLAFESITDAELDANPGLVRTMSVQPPRGVGAIRMVRIPGVDFQPCGGTHVRNTGEIGQVEISKIENKGKRNRRVHLKLLDQAD